MQTGRHVEWRRRARPAPRAAALLLAIAGGAIVLAGEQASSVSAATSTRPAEDVQALSAEQLVARGRERLLAGQAGEAVELLSRAVLKNPDQLETALALAEAYVAAGRPDAARALLQNLLARRPDSPAVCTALAGLQTSAGEWAAAVRTLEPLAGALSPDGVRLLAEALRQTGKPAESADALERGLQRYAEDQALWLAWIDAALLGGRPAVALQRVEQAGRRFAPTAAVYLRAARAHFELGQVLGHTQVRAIPDGRVGQFMDKLLIVEPRGGEGRFLCCPEASALYQLRRALDAGLNDPAAHLLHARIYQRAGRAKVAMEIVRAHEEALLDTADAAAFEALGRLALDAGSVSDFLRYARRRAERDSARGPQILADAYLQAAEQYNQRGEEALFRGFLRRAHEQRPTDARLMLRLADAEWAADHHGEAAELYQRVLSLDAAPEEHVRILDRMAEWESSGRKGD